MIKIIKWLICLFRGHDFEKAFYRHPVYEFWREINNSYRQAGTESDQDETEMWCHRCCKYRKV